VVRSSIEDSEGTGWVARRDISLTAVAGLLQGRPTLPAFYLIEDRRPLKEAVTN
jgi:hypothetical protein